MKTTPDQFERSWRIAVLGAFLCAREAVPDMLKRQRGAIVFTGATSSVRGRGGAVAFSSAKFAVRGLAESLAVELWPRGIHVAHVVIDGLIDTPKIRRRYKPSAREPLLKLEAIADSYWNLIQQDRSAHGAWRSICALSERPFSNDSSVEMPRCGVRSAERADATILVIVLRQISVKKCCGTRTVRGCNYDRVVLGRSSPSCNSVSRSRR
jgi:NAD(P)-dependent dehydrogenase (short-subunit alcohol dehydrogenase family)